MNFGKEALNKQMVTARFFFVLIVTAFLFLAGQTACFATTVTLQWNPVTDSGLAGYKVYYQTDSSVQPFTGTGATQGSSPLVFAKTQTSATIGGLDPAHKYYFAVTAYNTSGAESAYSNVVGIKEWVSPTVTISSPTNNTTVSGTVSVTASASDNFGVTQVEFYLNGVRQATVTDTPYVYSWNTSALATGTYTLMAKAYDGDGNIGQSGNVSVTVIKDTTSPTVSVTSPANNAKISGTVAITASASDNVGVSSVVFYKNDEPMSAANVAPYRYDWNTTTVTNGSYTLTAKACDTSGNISQSNNITVTVNNTTDSSAPASTVAGIALIQKTTNKTPSAQNLSSTLPSPVTAGNLIIVSVSGWPNLPATTPITDSLGNTYSIAGNILASQGTYSAIYYAKNIKGGTNTVTFKTVASGGQISMAVAEFSGVDTVSPLDSTAGTVGSGTAPSSGTMTPSRAGDLVIGVGTHNGTTVTTAGSGFTMIAIPTENSETYQPLAMEYQVLSGSQSVSATFNLGAGYQWTQNGALFKPAADTTSPIVVITAPQNNTTVSNTVTVSTTVSDNIGVSRIEFYLDGLLQSSDSTMPYEWSWDSLKTANGSHTLMAKAYDTAGNIGTSSSVIVTVSNAAIAMVQKATNITLSAQNLSSTLPSPVTAGNLIVVSVSGWPNLPATTPITDSLGNTYSIAGNILASQGTYSAIYYAKNIKGGTNTVTFKTVASGGQISMAVAEFSGVDTASPLDSTAGTVGSGTAPSSGTMTPSQAGDLVIGSGTHNGTTVTTAGSGFTIIAIPTENSATYQPLAMEYQVLSGSQSVSATFNLGAGYSWTQNGALFKHK